MLVTSIHIIWVPLILLIGAFLGFFFRSNQIAKCRKRILTLENEMLNNHAEILKLQQELVGLEKAALGPSKTPVVSIKEVPQQDNPETKPPIKKSINP